MPEADKEALCEMCGIENHSSRHYGEDYGYKVTQIVLTVAHLDQDIRNNDPDNLAALCQRCHLQWDRPWHLINASITRDRNHRQLQLAYANNEDWTKNMTQKRLTHSFNVLLSEEEMTMLSHMAEISSTNKSIVIRQAVRYRFQMEIGGVPVCANGRGCFVPHMHAQAPAMPLARPPSAPGEQEDLLPPETAQQEPRTTEPPGPAERD